MPVRVASEKSGYALRRLVKTMRTRNGMTTKSIAAGAGWNATAMSKWMNDPAKGISLKTYDRLLTYVRGVLPQDLIAQAYSDVEPPPPRQVRARRNGKTPAEAEVFTFQLALHRLEEVRAGLLTLTEGMPGPAKEALHRAVIESVELAIEGLR